MRRQHTQAAGDERVGISTISFRHRSLAEALRIIAGIGVRSIELGAIPRVTDHVSVPFEGDAAALAESARGYGLEIGAVNSDPGDLNDPDLDEGELRRTVRGLAAIASEHGGVLITPAGRQCYEPFVSFESDLELIAQRLRIISEECARLEVRLLVEVLHHLRFLHSVRDADRLLEMCGDDVMGLLFDVSHVVASGDDPVAWARTHARRIERVHLRDAVPGNLNLALGTGAVDFKAVISTLESEGFAGKYVLELETHNVEEHEREADAERSYRYVRALLAS